MEELNVMHNENQGEEPGGTSDEKVRGYRELFLAACVIESWVYRMNDFGSSDECVVCGVARQGDDGAFVGTPFLRFAMRTIEVMVREAEGRGASGSEKWLTFDMLRYHARYLLTPKDNALWCCAQCFSYTMDTLRVLVTEARGVSPDEAGRWVLATLQHEGQRWAM